MAPNLGLHSWNLIVYRRVSVKITHSVDRVWALDINQAVSVLQEASTGLAVVSVNLTFAVQVCNARSSSLPGTS